VLHYLINPVHGGSVDANTKPSLRSTKAVTFYMLIKLKHPLVQLESCVFIDMPVKRRPESYKTKKCTQTKNKSIQIRH
jgi:hypothetical protein